LIGDCNPNGATIIQDITCASVPFNLEPGDILDTDLHLTGNGFMVGLPVELPVQTKMSVVVAPNPFSDFTQLYFESDEDLSDVIVHIYNASGSIVKSYQLPQAEKTMLTIRKSDLGAAGIYSFILQRESNVLRSGKLVCN